MKKNRNKFRIRIKSEKLQFENSIIFASEKCISFEIVLGRVHKKRSCLDSLVKF